MDLVLLILVVVLVVLIGALIVAWWFMWGYRQQLLDVFRRIRRRCPRTDMIPDVEAYAFLGIDLGEWLDDERALRQYLWLPPMDWAHILVVFARETGDESREEFFGRVGCRLCDWFAPKLVLRILRHTRIVKDVTHDICLGYCVAVIKEIELKRRRNFNNILRELRCLVEELRAEIIGM